MKKLNLTDLARMFADKLKACGVAQTKQERRCAREGFIAGWCLRGESEKPEIRDLWEEQGKELPK